MSSFYSDAALVYGYSNAALVYGYYRQYNARIELFKHGLECVLYNLSPKDAVRFVLHCMSRSKGHFQILDHNSTFKDKEITECKRKLPTLLQEHPFDMIVLLTKYLQKSIDKCNTELTSIVMALPATDIKAFFNVDAKYGVRSYDDLSTAEKNVYEAALSHFADEDAIAILNANQKCDEKTKEAINNKLKLYERLLKLTAFIDTLETQKNRKAYLTSALMLVFTISSSSCFLGMIAALKIGNLSTMICVMALAVLATITINLAMHYYNSMKKIEINNTIAKTYNKLSEYINDIVPISTNGADPADVNNTAVVVEGLFSELNTPATPTTGHNLYSN